jgi:hypothetical protein
VSSHRRTGRPERHRRGRAMSRRVLIVAEGQETEINYFDGLKRSYGVRETHTVHVKSGKPGSPVETIQVAVREKRNSGRRSREFRYDEVWCVLDVEGSSNRKQLEQAIQLSQENGIKVCLSNPAFEVWFLAHFRKSCQPFHDAEDVLSMLKPLWKRVLEVDYQKNDEQIYRRLADKLPFATSNAQMVFENDHRDKPLLDRNSSTEVYKLVEALTRPI